MPRFRKIPHEVEAKQFRVGKKPWPAGVEKHKFVHFGSGIRNGRKSYYYLKLEAGPEPSKPGDTLLSIFPGDYIITRPDGTRFFQQARDFEREYEEIK